MLIISVAVSIALLALGSRCALCDRVEILDAKESQATSEKMPEVKAATLKSYFEEQGFRTDFEESERDRYSTAIVSKMAEALRQKEDFFKFYILVCEINSMIHGLVAVQVTSADEAVLQTLDLIVPKTESQQIFDIAKKDLRLFYEEQPERGRELLEKVGEQLDRKSLHTQDAINYLEGFFHNWIPFGRLALFIDEKGHTDS
jgi:hypothetical protein